jgi:hypothetical protein
MTTEQFNILPVNEKAILVAKDVLAQIKAEKYIAYEGSYISFYGSLPFEGSIKENFNELPQCKVCALGSMLLSSTHLGNVLTTKDMPDYPDADELRDSEKITNLFNSIFTDKQLLMIETTFEGYSEFYDHNKSGIKKKFQEEFNYYECSDRYAKEKLTFDETLACEMFYRKYKDSEKRLKAICRNIIKNNGVFIP